jgi:Ser/Thr protein kinase RdoA (MazF antagonist)
MEIAPGRPVPAKTWDPVFFAKWGETIGRLHHLAQQYPSWQASLDPETGEALLTWREECRGFTAWTQDADAKAAWADMERELDALPVTREVFGFTHNDPHIWNLLYDGERLTLLDFDVANHHWFINDLAIACQSILFEQTGGMDRPVYDHDKLRAFFGHVLEGYERQHHLATEWLNRLDLFIAYRRLLLFTVMQGWIGAKPDWRASWKRMIQARPPVVGTC